MPIAPARDEWTEDIIKVKVFVDGKPRPDEEVEAMRFGLFAVHPSVSIIGGKTDDMVALTHVPTGMRLVWFKKDEDAMAAAEMMNHRLRAKFRSADPEDYKSLDDMPNWFMDWVAYCRKTQTYKEPG